MTDFVRVKTENGGTATVPQSFADRHNMKRLDKEPALGTRSKPLPPTAPVEKTDVNYVDQTNDWLVDEIKRRNANLAEDAQISTTGTKAVLVAALEANDKSEEDQ